MLRLSASAAVLVCTVAFATSTRWAALREPVEAMPVST
jgi:hypothetical protein